MERPERHHKLQDIIPQHWGESTTSEDLNEFYCRFEIPGLTPHTRSEHLSTQPLTPLTTPLLRFRSVKMMCIRSSESRREKKHQAQKVSHQPVWKPVLTSWPTSSHRSSTITGAVRSLCLLQMLTIIPIPKIPKLQDLMITDLLP